MKYAAYSALAALALLATPAFALDLQQARANGQACERPDGYSPATGSASAEAHATGGPFVGGPLLHRMLVTVLSAFLVALAMVFVHKPPMG